MKAKYDIERAKLDVNKGDTVSRIENEQAKLALGDAEQRLKEVEVKMRSDRTSAEADLSSKLRKREKALFDLKRAEARAGEAAAQGAGRRHRQRPAELPLRQHVRRPRPSSAKGDRAWAGAAILELPDLSSVHLEARLDESDRGRLKAGQDGDRPHRGGSRQRLQGHGSTASRCWRASTSASGWPPPRNFDLGLVLIDVDPRIRPGMTAVARIATERVPDVVLVPVRGDLPARRRAGRLQARRLRVRRSAACRSRERGKEQAIVASGVAARRSHRDAASRAGDDQEDANEAPPCLLAGHRGSSSSALRRRRRRRRAARCPSAAIGVPTARVTQGAAEAHRPRDRRAARRPDGDARDAAGRRHAAHRHAGADRHAGQERRRS